MKWKDLSLKERKQIYDSVRVNNPDATYLDIKQQFDSIPEYEDGKAGYTPEERAWVAGNRSYLLNPTEAKSHMLTLKRSLKDSGKIHDWSSPVDESMVLEYINSPTPNKLIKDQYNLYRNKNEYIERLNKLIPMEILMPLGGAGVIGNELNKQ